jgi:acyl-CoA synthetase (AMP-forming)/AMP-acid ligase II
MVVHSGFVDGNRPAISVPKALVVLKPGEITSEADIIDFVRQNLARYKVPKSVEFRKELPKSGTGKLLKRELRGPYWTKYAKQVH